MDRWAKGRVGIRMAEEVTRLRDGSPCGRMNTWTDGYSYQSPRLAHTVLSLKPRQAATSG